MSSDATSEDATLLLRLYELRSEKLLRRARDFVQNGCKVTNYKDFQKRYPEGSRKRSQIDMVVEYWETACTLATKGLINEELFNSTNFEHVTLWIKLRPLAQAWRAELKNPDFLRSLEAVAHRHPAAAALLKPGKAPGKAGAPVARHEHPAQDEGATQEATSVA